MGLFLALVTPLSAHATPLAGDSFTQLAVELAPKVNLFRDVWTQVPDAKFTGGTVRDYLYWLRQKLTAPQTEADLTQTVANLRALPMIDVREFVHEESDIDYASTSVSARLTASEYGVKKLDRVSLDRFTPGNPSYQSELDQGFLPIEKILLSQTELVTAPGFGDGVQEIFTASPSVHFSSREEFGRSHYAKLRANHPILLAMRFIRTLSLNYAKTVSKNDLPELTDLLKQVGPETEAQILSVVASVSDSSTLSPYFKNESFKKWYRETQEKSFRAYVNPTATYLLYQHFGIDRLVRQWAQNSVPINQFLYAMPRLPRHLHEFDERIRALGFEPNELFEKPETLLGDSRLAYHGTRTEEAFIDIERRGIIQSQSGSAGSGVYCVPESNKWFAANWGSSSDRLIQFEVDASARILDLTSPSPRARAFFRKTGLSYDDAAKTYGIDAYKYPYEVSALVIKNSGVIKNTVGVNRRLLTYGEALELASKVTDANGLLTLLESLSLQPSLTRGEWNGLMEQWRAAYSHIPELEQINHALDSTGHPGDVVSAKIFAYALFALTKSDHGMKKNGISETFARRLLFLPLAQINETPELRAKLASIFAPFIQKLIAPSALKPFQQAIKGVRAKRTRGFWQSVIQSMGITGFPLKEMTIIASAQFPLYILATSGPMNSFDRVVTSWLVMASVIFDAAFIAHFTSPYIAETKELMRKNRELKRGKKAIRKFIRECNDALLPPA